MTSTAARLGEDARVKTVILGRGALGIDDVDLVARGLASVSLAEDARREMERSVDFALDLVRRGVPVYGLTTGCGPLAGNAVESEAREAFQRNLIRSHAVSLGEPLPAEVVRAAMVTRAEVLARGRSAVAPAAVDVLVGMLEAGIHPIVRRCGSVGASGDLVELAQIALAAIGEGDVSVRGERVPAKEALSHAGIRVLEPRLREGLALINGTSCHTGAAALHAARARRVLDAAVVAAAMLFDALGGKLEALDPALHEARPHPGQARVARRMSQLLEGSALASGESPASCQDAYSLRCVPQIIGAADDAIEAAIRMVEIELGSIADNPLFLASEDRVVHGGNFHGQPVAMALDQMKTAVVEIGVLSERRIARALDPKLNEGLPPFLVRGFPGRDSGFMGLQYVASSMAAENAILSAPASVRSVPTNANNQDVVSMGMVAARHLGQVLDNVERMVAIELACGAQALEIRGIDRAAPGVRSAHDAVRLRMAPLVEDRPLEPEIAELCQAIRSGALAAG